MKIVADLHIHSHFSRATSKNLDLEHLSKWAQLKGVDVVGTGDIAHPGWLAEMQEKLEPAEDGLFRLKEELTNPIQAEVFKACRRPVRFMLAGEISNIYKRHDKVRKIHNVVFLPSFEAVEKFQAKLETIGNIRSDGRPILGLDSRDLLEIVLETDPQGYLIPAHIWTPWFAMMGSMSGFDSVEACFGDLTPHIFALETGLSSDPPMNWRLSMLDKYTLVSNSDAHSPPKLAREANVFDTDLSYEALFAALKSGNPNEFLGTIEFFPEEGKYHYDGHRKCGIRWDPKTTLANDCICSVCGKKVTVGVSHRVEALADRGPGAQPVGRLPFSSLVPLPELLSEIHGMGVNSQRVQHSFEYLLARLGPELHILQDLPLDEIEKHGGPMVAEGLRRMRKAELQLAAGYDGEFGTIRLFEEHEREQFSSQLGFFVENAKNAAIARREKLSEQTAVQSDKDELAKREAQRSPGGNGKQSVTPKPEPGKDSKPGAELSPQQLQAAQHGAGPLLIVAGPGTGKTRVLTYRIVHLIEKHKVAPSTILALTFTNKAAQEMAERLERLIGRRTSREIHVCTFHAFCARYLADNAAAASLPDNSTICGERQQKEVLRSIRPQWSSRELDVALQAFSMARNRVRDVSEAQDGVQLENLAGALREYEDELVRHGMVDFDGLLTTTLHLLRTQPASLRAAQARFKWVQVDEYQDVNRAQYEILKILLKGNRNICVVGDPDQAIYGFRGASSQYFDTFRDDYPEAEVVRLSQSYRSTQALLKASSQMIAPSQSVSRKIWSEILSNTKVNIYVAPTGKAEAEYVVHSIEKLVGGTSYFSIDSGRVGASEGAPEISFGDIAVLYRMRRQSHLLVEAFERSGMPFQTVGEAPFFEKPSVKHVIDYLRFTQQPENDINLQAILQHAGGGIGPAAVEIILSAHRQPGVGLWDTLTRLEGIPGLNRSQWAGVVKLRSRLAKLVEGHNRMPVSELAKTILQWTQTPGTEKEFDSQAEKLLLQTKYHGQDLQSFLERAALATDTDELDPRADRVALMTMHASKGLEFPFVFIVGCEEGLAPLMLPGAKCDINEERRLLYVGMTRAGQNLVLTRAQKRILFGKETQNQQSRFLDDIQEALKENIRREPKKSKESGRQSTEQIDLF